MQNINNFLERFKNIAIPDETIRKELTEIIQSETGINIEFKDVYISGLIAYIKCSGSSKSEIFLNKKRILDKLKWVKTDKEILDIR